MTDYLHALRLITDSGMVVLIWLVQLAIYPSFSRIDSQRFMDWHQTYIRRISFIVIPLMLAQAAVIGLQLVFDFGLLHLVSAGFAALAWGVTFLAAVPLHRALQQQGNCPALVFPLTRINWWRTIAWSVVFVAGTVGFFMS